MNNDNSRISLNKVNYNSLEKNLFPFFQALPQDVPVDWMIPFFYLIEDLQLIRFIFNDNILGKLRPFYGKIFSIFNPTIKSYFYFYVVFGLIIISTIYIYSILCYFINTRRSSKTLSKKKLWFLNSMYIILYKYLLSYVFLFLTQGILLCKQYKIPGLDKCDSMFSKIEIGVSIGCTILIIIYNIMVVI
ncbi:hypothetical protein BCR36DRAFT_150009 [Piromyces finnis]|uniref:Uncharacterized protein n=1 Tax=Piromyces finnis TaxID=1754191 RepID=A0A1Y1UZK2_9FUNG|nr:hypothetical protein BCR36DRAFT_150009 [Piromyces finnis]|eukprot:ORX42840.1 hypothetical protein BCR36DRAFT_150009 [Piromyces finnis]